MGRRSIRSFPFDRGIVMIRPHQEDFGKGILRVLFSGIYPYSRDISVQAPYPYPVNDQLPDLAKADHGGYQRVLPVLSSLKNPILLTASRMEISATNPCAANCKEGVCGQNGQHRTSCTYSKRVAAHHPSSWALRRPSSEKSALSLPPSRLPSWPTTRHCGGRPHTAPFVLLAK